jgi:hypothetical protein
MVVAVTGVEDSTANGNEGVIESGLKGTISMGIDD